MRTETTERIASSKIIRVVMSIALALSVCASASISAFAGESVNVTIGDDIPYAGYLTTPQRTCMPTEKSRTAPTRLPPLRPRAHTAKAA